jgi:hypothetical protein
MTIDWSDPTARFRLYEQVGPDRSINCTPITYTTRRLPPSPVTRFPR